MVPKLRLAGGLVVSLLLAAPTLSAQENYGILNGKIPEEGVLFGGQPTSEQLAQMAADGFEVINLRMPEEDAGFDEVALLKELEVVYHSVPVSSEALASDEPFERFFELFESAARPLLVHCASGNRVGALYYAYLAGPQGVPREEALAAARENGLRSNALVELVDRYLERRVN